MTYAINYRETKQIGEYEYHTFTRTILVDENTTIGQAIEKIRTTGCLMDELHVELNSVTQ